MVSNTGEGRDLSSRLSPPLSPRLTALLLLCGLALAPPVWAGEPVTPEDVEGPYVWGSAKNVTRLGHLWFSAQPDAVGLAAARDAGVEVVIDLRDPSERGWDEALVVEGLGLVYHSVPVSGAAFDPEALARIQSLVEENAEEQILIHCSSANRVGGWLAVSLVENRGMTEEDALAVGRRVGITKPVIEKSVHVYLAGQRARQALAPLKQGLMTALKGAMAESPQAAVQTCRLAAPSITEGAQGETVAVGRTSHRTRNPANDPEPWMQPLLDEYLETPTQPRPPRVVELGERGTGYVEPIYLQEMCATCHGDAVDPELLGLIRERYPEDRAVGFAPGELRGLFWVVMAPGS